MQLIPETQQRFGVTRPFDPEQNIKEALPTSSGCTPISMATGP